VKAPSRKQIKPIYYLSFPWYTYGVSTPERIVIHRKIFMTGNSLVVSLPKDLLEPLGMGDGTDVSVELDQQNHQILIRPAELPLAGDLSEKFAHQVCDFIEQYRPALEALAHK
jgi:antitoxin component of MazEF toxin-antitoxin module